MLEKKGQRRGKNNKQESKSLGQLIDTLSEWLTNRLAEDFGEDMIVQVEDDGEWTGLSFFLQAKSNTDLQGKKLKREDVFSYQLDVIDLLRWEDTSPPVVVVVWDVVARTGVWIDVPAAIRRLDQASDGWRDRQSANVHFPVANRLDLQGQATLRRRLADLALPSVGKGKQVAVKPIFQFPDDEEGRALREQLRATIDEGEAVTIPAKYIKSFKMSDWWERLYGRSEVGEISIGPSVSDATLDFELVAVGPDRSHIEPIRLKRVKGGLRKLTFSNELSGAALRVTLVLPGSHAEDESALDCKFSFTFPCKTVSETSKITGFLLAIHNAGGCVLKHKESGVELGELQAEQLRGVPSPLDLEEWEILLKKLAFIETKTAQYGQFDPTLGLSDDDLEVIERLYLICQNKPWSSKVMLTFTVNPAMQLPKESEGETVITLDPFGEWELLGVTIPLGQVRMIINDSARFLKALRETERTKKRNVVLKDLSVSHELLTWGEFKKSPREKGRVRNKVK